jgi:acyl-CoA reductase-like NAD-dependent aldehyde dehydrogenase
MTQTVFTENFIGGRRVAPLGNEILEVRSPFDGRLVGRVPLAGSADVDLAVRTARDAFDDGPWPRLAPAERQAVLSRFAKLHAPLAEEFAQLVTRENGSPLWHTRAIQGCVAVQNAAYLKAAAGFPWETVQTGFPAGETLWRKEPVGVVAAIVPWNAPQQSALVKMFPALLAGCAVILKTAPETPLDGHRLGELFNQAGVPEGVVSILTADREVSETLVRHPGVDKIAFTGSTAAGRRIASIAAGEMKRVSMELGGKSAALILEDADIAATVAGLRHASLSNSGQMCIAQTRILVPRSIHDVFVEALVEDVRSLKIGDPADPETFFGPLVAERQRERVSRYLQIGIDEGAKAVIGGLGLPDGIEQGAFVKPTVFIGVNNRMRIAREEIFGPVLAVIPYEGVEEGIAIANDTPYGLSGGVWTRDRAAGMAIAKRIRAGTISVAGAFPNFLSPFGGHKQSGLGREFGTEGLNHYVENKSIGI